jgi:hypothetical protein
MMRPKAVSAALAVVLGVSAPVAQQSATPAQRPPVFRAGAHYVRVDAYPTRDGRIIEGLTKDDFEIFEDGAPQAIENAEYITFDTWIEAMEDATGARRLPAGADVQAIAETADGVDIGSARTRFDPAARGALVRLPLQSRQRAASAIVRIRGDGMLFTDRVIVPHATVLAGDAVAYRNGAPAAVLICARSDRLRFEWPILAPVETLDARLLDRRGQPLAVRLPVVQSGSDSKRIAAVELALASLGRGDYLVELTVRAHGVTERKLMALRVT